jgi:hypothetical protein
MTRIVAIVLASATLAACAETPMSPGATASAPPPAYGGAGSGEFRARDFAWSTNPGVGAIMGGVGYRTAETRYTCQGKDVILTPETPWSRLRMIILYGSATSAVVPLDVVRARTPAVSAGDYASYVRKASCDGANHFAFNGLPDGAWFVITIARPTDGPGEAMALMRRVETHGAPKAVTLN